jgi:Methylase involved in ubiquinone/menaquinone biosynthesis
MIDRQLNYGRHLIQEFLQASMTYKSVLDIGAGYGDDLQIARQINPSTELFALENCDTFIKKLINKQIKVYPVNIEHDIFPFSDQSVDTVIANQILEHTKELFWIFHEISRILPVGGKLIVGVPNLASLHNRILLSLGKQPTPIQNNSAHIRGYTKHDFLQFLECFPGGYKLLSFGGSNFYPFPPRIASPLARTIPTMAWSIFFLLEKQRKYEREFLEFPQMNELQTNFYLGS